MHKTSMKLAASAVLALTSLTMSASAETYQASTWLPPSYPQSVHAYAGLFDRVREATGGEIDVEVHYSGALLPAKTTLTGVRDGVADFGFVYPGYMPAELPVQALLNNTSFVSDDSLAVALAYTEFNFTDPAALAEWDKFDVIFTGAFSTPVYHFMCNQPVTTLEEAKGMRMRTAGASFTSLVDSLGGTAVSVPIGDAYSGMQRGSLECIVADPTNLVSASFNEVVSDITTISLGVVTGADWVIAKDTWEDFSAEQKQLLKDEMALALVRTQMQFASDAQAAFDDAVGRGIVLHDAGEDLSAHVADFKAGVIENLIAEASTVDNPQAVFDQYTQLQADWTARLAEIDRSDEAAILALVQEHLMSKFPE
ncbi:C4-dicarboxylate TRAP transporter substrate-binding protein [Celeribacter neptunius]|uniref:TRAP-type C4-dicarboxylate transport system, substrate-binding protein n=1 Tax=Celeribacter neptunius TaxID=588602 RepID=A0A1I3S521_9RHOB|nr:C4-dicarboxylate TRAP transporter substrate-binding protein [Celeribacter neptunius]SFJ53943.1 TRAP-type C4-dicarboxylate transport system, substrate-binding protein [Celeribacter neptunius]